MAIWNGGVIMNVKWHVHRIHSLDSGAEIAAVMNGLEDRGWHLFQIEGSLIYFQKIENAENKS